MTATSKKVVLIIISALVLITSCTNKEKEAEEEALISYITKNNIEIEPFESGLYYIPYNDTSEIVSNFTNYNKGDSLILKYKGYLLSNANTIFIEKSEIDPGIYVYNIDNIIDGFKEGVGYIKKGDSAQLIIPSELAYGEERVGLIPPYSTLIFTIKVIDVK